MLEREPDIEPISFATRMTGILHDNQSLVDKIKALRTQEYGKKEKYQEELNTNAHLIATVFLINSCCSIGAGIVFEHFHFNIWLVLLGAIGTLIGLSYFPYRVYAKNCENIEINQKNEENTRRRLEEELSAYEAHIMPILREEAIQFECLAHVDTLLVRMRAKYGRDLFHDNKMQENIFLQRVSELKKDFIKVFHMEDDHHTYQSLISLFFKVQQIELDIEEYYQNNAVLQQQAQTFTAFEKKYQQFFHEQNAELQAIVRHTL